jgi:two-component system OmpR family response regulator
LAMSPQGLLVRMGRIRQRPGDSVISEGRFPTYDMLALCDLCDIGRARRNMGNPGHRLRVYVVEDSAKLVRRLLELLDGIGVENVGHTDTAATAIREIAAASPDVVIVDIALRRGNGFDVLRALDSGNAVRRPITIVLSNYTTQPYRAAAKRLQVEYYFDKGSEVFTMLEVVASIARSIGLRNGSDS